MIKDYGELYDVTKGDWEKDVEIYEQLNDDWNDLNSKLTELLGKKLDLDSEIQMLSNVDDCVLNLVNEKLRLEKEICETRKDLEIIEDIYDDKRVFIEELEKHTKNN